MIARSKTLFAWLCILLCSAWIGCNRGGETDQDPKSPSNEQTDGTPSADGDTAGNAKKPATDPKHPLVLIETSLGNITVRLDKENAPITVDNFIEYVNASHYDQTIVHQVYKGQGFIGGGYDVDLKDKNDLRTPIFNEARNGLKNLRGSISMVRFPDAIHSATCQFFINVADNPALDYKDQTPEGYGYCVFGEVVDGLETVDLINEAAVHDIRDFERTPVTPVVIKSIRRLR